MPSLTKGYDFLRYIDESGDEGFKFKEGSSEWFILAGLITTVLDDPLTIETVNEVKSEIDLPEKKQLHWKKLHHLEKKYYATEIIKKKCHAVVIAVYKPEIIEREKFQGRYLLYFYTVRYLLERVSWCIRDLHNMNPQDKGLTKCIFSNRAGMSYEELKNYLKKLKGKSESGHDIRIDWNHIDPEHVVASASGKLKGLQLADAIAGAFYNGFESSKTAKQRPDYALILKPIVYRHKGVYWGNGFKIVPREALQIIENDVKWKWCKEYQK